MEVANRLFHHDSRGILDHLHTPSPKLPGCRELTVLAVSLLLRGAGLDWYEQGDVWAKLAELRPPTQTQPPVAERIPASLRRLMTTPAGPESPLVANGPLAPVTDWLAESTAVVMGALTGDDESPENTWRRTTFRVGMSSPWSSTPSAASPRSSKPR
jgi:thiopeptide-type bacteriocin biosynthesis protein